MEFVSEKLNVKFNGVVYELSYPTVRQIKQLDKSKDDIDLNAVCEMVEASGMPMEIIESLQSDHLNSLVEALVGKGKPS